MNGIEYAYPVIAAALTAGIMYLSGKAKYQAFKKAVHELDIAMQDDRITVDEIKGFWQDINDLVK